MRRFIIGAVALVTGLLAAGGVALTTRRRRDRDEVLPLDVAPPLGADEPDDIAHASVEADFGPTVAAAEAEAPVAPKRKRVRRKPAKAATGEASSTESASTADSASAVESASAADPPDAVTANEAPSSSASADDPASAPAAATASDPAPAATPGARTAEAAEAAAAAEAAELSGSPELPSAS